MKHRKLAIASSLGWWLAAVSVLRAAELPKLVVPEALGVNIHFTDPRPGEMEMLAQGGFRWVRMDFAWGGIEREKGKYDFSAYERLMAALDPHKVRALLILDYSNPHYDKGLSPASDEGRKAFARWAAAAARHFRGRGILWEMYNEPNIGFWKPEPDVKQYVKLALEVGKALREAAPEETYIGPATSEIDLRFLEGCFQAGLLDYWSAVSVHPYRQSAPETAAAEYATLRRLIAKYAPQGKAIPILSGEWGYSSVWGHFDDVKQGKFLPRQWLVNLANDVPLSIWYDWHDDGPDPKESEHHFGTVRHDYRAGRDPVYDPKPAYLAAKTLTTVLGGFSFSKRLVLGDEDEHVLLFAKGEEVRLAAWTTSPTPRTVLIPASPGRFRVTAHTGEILPAVAAHAKGLSVILGDSPQYLVPDGPNDLLRVAAAWQRAPLELALRAPQKAEIATTIANPLGRPIRVVDGRRRAVELAPGESATLVTPAALLRSDAPVTVSLTCEVDRAAPLVQTTRLIATNPLRVSLGAPAANGLAIRVENPSGEPFDGVVRLSEVSGLRVGTPSAKLQFGPGERDKDLRFDLQDGRVKNFQFGVRVEDDKGRLQLGLPAVPMTLVDDFSRWTPETLAGAWQMAPDGDAKVASTQSVTVAEVPAGPSSPGGNGLKIAYRMDKGWKFVRLVPQTEALRKIDGRPKSLAVWVHGDGSHNALRLRFVDAAGQTFQPDGPRLDWKGWRSVAFPMDGTSAGHWGGKNDGLVRYPIRWDSLLLIDSTRRETGLLAVFVSSPVLIYPEQKPAKEKSRQ
jgi:hypothetical protein